VSLDQRDRQRARVEAVVGLLDEVLNVPYADRLLARPRLAPGRGHANGRTETPSSVPLPETLAWLVRLLEVGPAATEEPGIPEGRKDGSEPGRLP
jgi:hypothetical protein